MFETLISRNPDLSKLQEAGLRLRIIAGKSVRHLIVDGVPAVNSKREVIFGSLYSPLEIDQNEKTRNPVPNHQCWWIGDEQPCDPSGGPMKEFESNPAEEKGDGIKTLVGYSMKFTQNGVKVQYPNYYEKIRAYVGYFWSAAQELDPSCTPYSDRPVPAVIEQQKQVFRYPDMATTRAGIGAATAKLLAEKIAIIGLGGTGSYILDLLAKVPVGQIHLFDQDIFQLHNAYRAPAAPQAGDLDRFRKVEWFASIYGRMHTAIIPHPYHITESNLAELADFDFVFVAVDKPTARKVILPGLIARKIPFIDVGMGLDLDRDYSVTGIVRYTVGLPDFNAHVEQVVSFDDGADEEVYRNIQVADINMLNAALAVIRWKKLRGFYADTKREHHGQYNIASGSLVREDCR